MDGKPATEDTSTAEIIVRIAGRENEPIQQTKKEKGIDQLFNALYFLGDIPITVLNRLEK